MCAFQLVSFLFVISSASRCSPPMGSLDAAAAAVDAHVAVGGLALLLENLVGAIGVGLVLEGDGGGCRGEEAKCKEAAIATGGRPGGDC